VIWSKEKRDANGALVPSHQVFQVPLYTSTGVKVTAFIHVMESTAWVVMQLLKSGDLHAPEDGSPFILSADHLEGRRFYFGIEHHRWNDQVRPNVKFHSQVFAEQVNPLLTGVTFPHEPPRGIKLQSAEPPQDEEAPLRPVEEVEQELEQKVAKKAPTAPPTAQAPTDEGETLSDEEFAQAIEYAKQLKREKK
jgi:hypothetical protein